jgi:hypothetical protein
MKFLNFLTYNNIVPIAISVMLLGAGGAFAAQNPDAIYSKQQKVLTVDNTYIANKDLASYTPQVRINGVTEDATSYSVSYSISTIDIKDYVWQDIMRDDVMKVSKSELNGRDLGVYVTMQLRNIIDNQLIYLKQVQEKARQQITQQTVATTYGGLVGRFLDATTETLPGYVPVVTPPPVQDTLPQPEQSASVATSQPTPEAVVPSTPTAPSPQQVVGASALLKLLILGNNPATVELNSTYVDLGVVLIDPGAPNLGYYTYVDGKKVSDVIIDTRKPNTYTVEYKATDQAGTEVVVSRKIIVGSGTPLPTDTAATSTATTTGQ